MGVHNAGKKWVRRFNRREGRETSRSNRAVSHFGRDAGDVFKNGKWWVAEVAERDSGTPERRILGRFKNRGRAQAALLRDAQARFDASPEGKAIYKARDETLARFGERIRELHARPTIKTYDPRNVRLFCGGQEVKGVTVESISYDDLEVRTMARMTDEQRKAQRQRMASANYSIVEAHGTIKGTLAVGAFRVKRGRGGRR